jgi:hypothetical protein
MLSKTNQMGMGTGGGLGATSNSASIEVDGLFLLLNARGLGHTV